MGASTLEFELKVDVASAENVTNVLRSLRFLRTETITDLYFDTPEHDLFRRAVFLRVRNSTILEIKHNSDLDDLNHVACQESKYPWPLNRAAKQAVFDSLRTHLHDSKSRPKLDPFEDFHLEEFVRIEKLRDIYTGPGIEASLDRISGLGTFLEIEAKGARGVKCAKQFCAKHGLQNLPLGYVELWLRKNDFQTYCRGKYVLSIDKTLKT